MGVLEKALAGLGKGAMQMAPIMIEELYRKRMLESQDRYRQQQLALQEKRLDMEAQYRSRSLDLQKDQLASIDSYRKGMLAHQRDQLTAQKEHWNQLLATEMANARARMAEAKGDAAYKAAKLELERLKAMKDMLGSATTTKVPLVLNGKIAHVEAPAFRLPDGRTVVDPRYSEAYFTSLALVEAKQRGLSFDDPQVTKLIAKMKSTNDAAWSKVAQTRMEVMRKFGGTLPGYSGVTVGDYMSSLERTPQQPPQQPPLDIPAQPSIFEKGAGLIHSILRGEESDRRPASGFSVRMFPQRPTSAGRSGRNRRNTDIPPPENPLPAFKSALDLETQTQHNRRGRNKTRP